MADEKDRLGSKLRDVEKAREDQWARQRDAELLEIMRKRLSQTACPNCKQFLVPKTEAGLEMNVCPRGHGAWLNAAALKTVLKEHKLTLGGPNHRTAGR
jgi:Transcription factor zinc-finger